MLLYLQDLSMAPVLSGNTEKTSADHVSKMKALVPVAEALPGCVFWRELGKDTLPQKLPGRVLLWNAIKTLGEVGKDTLTQNAWAYKVMGELGGMGISSLPPISWECACSLHFWGEQECGGSRVFCGGSGVLHILLLKASDTVSKTINFAHYTHMASFI